jgi:tol-pal system protein YbgF
MKKLCVAAALFAAACSSAPAEPEVTPAPAAAVADPRVGELQTQLTELLERIDVLNDRIARLEEGGAAQPVATPPATAATPRPATPQQTTLRRPASPSPGQPQQQAVVGAQIAEQYREAVTLFGRSRYADARRGFQAVFDADTNGDLADNALFWIGETYFATQDYTNAVRFYARVVNDYASQNKAPDALYKTAVVQVRTGDLALARRTLQQVIERYPYSSSASSAKAELERIKF